MHAQTPQNAMEMFHLIVAGWEAERAGQKAEAIRDLRESANLQDRLGQSYNTIKPMREMLADLLLINGDPAQPLVERRGVLAHKMNRFDSLNGAGASALALDDISTAKKYYKQLLTIAHGDDRPELNGSSYLDGTKPRHVHSLDLWGAEKTARNGALIMRCTGLTPPVA